MNFMACLNNNTVDLGDKMASLGSLLSGDLFIRSVAATGLLVSYPEGGHSLYIQLRLTYSIQVPVVQIWNHYIQHLFPSFKQDTWTKG